MNTQLWHIISEWNKQSEIFIVRKPRCQWPGAAAQRTSWLPPHTGSSSCSHCQTRRTGGRSLSGSPPRSDTRIDGLILERVEKTTQWALVPKFLNRRLHMEWRLYPTEFPNNLGKKCGILSICDLQNGFVDWQNVTRVNEAVRSKLAKCNLEWTNPLILFSFIPPYLWI